MALQKFRTYLVKILAKSTEQADLSPVSLLEAGGRKFIKLGMWIANISVLKRQDLFGKF
jgi:hypothetical protein